MRQQPDLTTTARREWFFVELYTTVFPAVAQHICKKGGSLEDANDVFQDALIAYYEKLVTGVVFENEKAYLMGICKNLWLKRFNSGKNTFNDDLSVFQIADEVEQAPSTGKLMMYLQTSGHKCMRLLKAFYYDQISVKQIAETLGYAGERSATVQKYKCLEKVRNTVKQHAVHYEDFIE